MNKKKGKKRSPPAARPKHRLVSRRLLAKTNKQTNKFLLFNVNAGLSATNHNCTNEGQEVVVNIVADNPCFTCKCKVNDEIRKRWNPRNALKWEEEHATRGYSPASGLTLRPAASITCAQAAYLNEPPYLGAGNRRQANSRDGGEIGQMCAR